MVIKNSKVFNIGMRAHPAASWCLGSQTYCGNNSGKWVAFSYVQLGFAVLGH